MLNSNDLVDLIISLISQKEDSKEIHEILGVQISKYLIQNLEIQGNYTGQILSAPPVPDPMSGPVKFRLMSCAILGEELLEFAKISLPMWYKALTTNIQITSIISLVGDKVVLNAPSTVFTPIVNSTLDLQDSKSLKETWSIIIDTLINDIKATIPISIPLPATSNAGGVGLVTLTKFN